MNVTRSIRRSVLGILVLLSLASSAHAGLTKLTVAAYRDYSFGMRVQGANRSSVASAFAARRVDGDPLPISHPNPFVTFCLDIDTTLSDGWWKSGTFSSTLTADTGVLRQPNGLYYAAMLYQSFAGGIMNATGGWIDKARGAALQLAIWEVLYETTAGAFSLGNGSGFKVTSGNTTVRNLAQTMLNSLNSGSSRIAPNLSINTMFWNATKSDGTPRASQDLIGPFTPVPEPSTYVAGLLLGLPILVNGLRHWRRKRG